LNGCNVSFAVSQIEDGLELNFRYVDYQTLAHLSCSSCVYWISARATRAQLFLSVRESISASIVDSTLVLVIFATLVKKRKVEIKMYIWLLEVRLKCFLDQFVLFIQSCKLPFRLRSMCCKDHYTVLQLKQSQS